MLNKKLVKSTVALLAMPALFGLVNASAGDNGDGSSVSISSGGHLTFVGSSNKQATTQADSTVGTDFFINMGLETVGDGGSTALNFARGWETADNKAESENQTLRAGPFAYSLRTGLVDGNETSGVGLYSTGSSNGELIFDSNGELVLDQLNHNGSLTYASKASDGTTPITLTDAEFLDPFSAVPGLAHSTFGLTYDMDDLRVDAFISNGSAHAQLTAGSTTSKDTQIGMNVSYGGMDGLDLSASILSGGHMNAFQVGDQLKKTASADSDGYVSTANKDVAAGEISNAWRIGVKYDAFGAEVQASYSNTSYNSRTITSATAQVSDSRVMGIGVDFDLSDMFAIYASWNEFKGGLGTVYVNDKTAKSNVSVDYSDITTVGYGVEINTASYLPGTSLTLGYKDTSSTIKGTPKILGGTDAANATNVAAGFGPSADRFSATLSYAF